MIQQVIPRSQSGFGVMDFVESNLAPQISPEFASYLRAGKSPAWNNFKRCQNLDEAKEMGFAMARDQLPLFKDKSNEEIEEWCVNLGKSHGFIDSK